VSETKRQEAENERPIRIRPRAPKQWNDTARAWPAALRRVLQLLQTTTKTVTAATGRGSRKARHRAVTRNWTQRCAVRVTYSPNQTRGQWAAHGRYVVRDSATEVDGTPKPGFDKQSDGADLVKTAGAWQAAGDPRMFKLIISPEFGERVDLKELTRQLMARMESDLGHPLGWAAVAHFNTEHPHVHVLLRGVAAGQELHLNPDYIKSGIRKQAEELCTNQLGYRTAADRAEAANREVDQPRFTTLDIPLRRQNTPANDHADSVEHFLATVAPTDQFLPCRLKVLQSMGLAEPMPGNEWAVRKDFESVLRAMKQSTDRQKMLARCAALVSDPRLPMQFTPPSRIRHLEGRVLGHVLDDASGKVHMLLEGTDAKVHIIPHDDAISTARNSGKMSTNSFATLRQSNEGIALSIEDMGDAVAYVNQMSTPTQKAVQLGILGPSVEPSWSGWLGRFQATHEVAQRHVERGR
jgi:type IV secretory pathway VirD2 relaxase